MIELVLEILYIYENKINSLTIFKQCSHRFTEIFIASIFLKAFFKRTIIWIQYYTIVETSNSLVVKCIGIINVNLLLCVQRYAFIVILNLHMNRVLCFYYVWFLTCSIIYLFFPSKISFGLIFFVRNFFVVFRLFKKKIKKSVYNIIEDYIYTIII